MMKQLCRFLFRLSGWKGDGVVVSDPKCIIIGVPHTSALDFLIVWIYYTSLGGKMNFLIKKEFFFWPFGFFVRRMGGISIDRSKGANVIRQTVREFELRDHLQLAILVLQDPGGNLDVNDRAVLSGLLEFGGRDIHGLPGPHAGQNFRQHFHGLLQGRRR